MPSEKAKKEIVSWEGDFEEDGEWCHCGNHDIEDLVDELVTLGLTEAKALGILSAAHSIVSNEYGG